MQPEHKQDIPNIPFIDLQSQRLRIADKVDARVQHVLQSGRYIMGPEVQDLEGALQEYTGSKHAIGCASGTDALLMALLALDVQPGDVVIVPAFTFIATAEAAALLGAIPLFVDVLEDTFNIDPESLAHAIQWAAAEKKPLKGVITVDLFGQPADYDALKPVIEAAGLWWILDAAQSVGATYKGRHVTTYGDIATTSFFPAKPLGCYGDGGAVFTERDDLAEKLKSIRVHGQGIHKYDNVRLGINGRLDTIQAAVVLEKLVIFPDEIIARQAVADRYTEALSKIVNTPTILEDTQSVWAQYTVTLPQGVDRQAFMDHLKEAGIPTMVYYPIPLPQQVAYKDYPVVPGGIPVTEVLSSRVISLPMHAYLNAEQQDYILKYFEISLIDK